jgi:F0F1-type ATP synthase assembly protein I
MASTTDAAARTPSARAHRRELWTGLDHSFVMGLELMAAVLLYAGLGHLADRWLGTGPWLFAIGALLGNAAGLYLIYVRSQRMDDANRAWRARGDADGR